MPRLRRGICFCIGFLNAHWANNDLFQRAILQNKQQKNVVKNVDFFFSTFYGTVHHCKLLLEKTDA